MADIFVSYTRADQAVVQWIVTLLEGQGWTVWWDTRIAAGEQWDEVIEREITTARCVVVVWTPQSVGRRWVREEAHHGRERGILVPILLDLDTPPFGFGLTQARNLTAWDGSTHAAEAKQVLDDVRRKLGETARQETTRAVQVEGRRPPMVTGEELRHRWKIPVAEARFHRDGTFYQRPTRFPAALCDRLGYVVFESELKLRDCRHLRVSKMRVNVRGGIWDISGYVETGDPISD